MFHSKQDVDRHVASIFKNMNSEHERNLRCYTIAKHYYAVNEFKSAIKYVNRYLSSNSNSAVAYALLGECYLHLNMKVKALEAFKASLENKGWQPDLVIKVCKLLSDPEVPLDAARATYWLERAESYSQKDPVIFKLKERILKSESNGQDKNGLLEKLILAEVDARPFDVTVRIRLLNFLMESERYQMAYDHALKLESKKLFFNDLRWYDCLCKLVEEYEKSDACPDVGFNSFELFVNKIIFLERKADLSMQEFQVDAKLIVDCISAVLSLDQNLNKSTKVQVPESEAEFFSEFMKHMGNQLCFHMATLILKRAKKEYGIWQKAVTSALPLLFLACQDSSPKDSWCNLWVDRNKSYIDIWNKAVSLRISQAGHVLLELSRDKGNLIQQKVFQFCGGKWRNRLYMDTFYNRTQGTATSYFLNSSSFADVPSRLYTEKELIPYDEMSQLAYPESLHHLVWLGLVSHKSNSQLSDDFRCIVVPDLQFTVDNLFNTGPETLNQLDVDAFLYASVLCAKSLEPSYQNSDKPSRLPVAISEDLCTPAQADWWTALYLVYKNKGTEDISDIRLKLRKGIETVRVIGQHGLHVKLIVLLAKLFQERAKKCKNVEASGLEARSHLYWSAAVPLLEKLEKCQKIRIPPKRLFDYRSKELSPNEIKKYLEDGRIFLACRLMKLEKYEEAIEAFESLKSPYSTFYQGLIFKKLALENFDRGAEFISSECNSQCAVLLTRARNAFFSTLERLRSPNADLNHPLNLELNAQLEEVESLLDQISSDVGRNSNENIETVGFDSYARSFPSDLDTSFNVEKTSDFTSTANDSVPSVFRNSFGSKNTNGKRESKPSLERLDAQLRHLVQTNKSELEVVVKELKELKLTQNELKEIKFVIQRELIGEVKMIQKELIGDVKIMQKELVGEVKMIQNEIKDMKEILYDMLVEMKKWNESDNGNVLPRRKGVDVLKNQGSDDSDNMTKLSHEFSNYHRFSNYRQVPQSQSTSAVAYAPTVIPQVSNILPATNINNSLLANTFFSPTHAISPQDSILFYQGLGYYGQGGHLTFAEGQGTTDLQKSTTFAKETGLTDEIVNSNAVTSANKSEPSSILTPSSLAISFCSTTPTISTLNTNGFVSSQSANNSLPNQAHAFQIPMPSNAHVVVPDEETSFKLFESQAKLFVSMDRKWNEQGDGIIKILHNDATGKVSIVMHRNDLKICANHYISSEMNICRTHNDERALMWIANDCFNGEKDSYQFLVQFKSIDEAKDFEYAFQRGREIAKGNGKCNEDPKMRMPEKPSSTKADLLNEIPNKNDTWVCCGNTYSNSIKICDICKTKEKVVEKPKIGGFTISNSSLLKAPVLKLDSSDKQTKEKEKDKPNPFSQFSFKIPSTSVPTNAKFQTSVTESQPLLTGNVSFTSLSACKDIAEEFKAKEKNSEEFEGTGNLVFGYLGKKSSNENNVTKKPDRGKTGNVEEVGVSDASDFVPTAEFTPVVPLPDLVEIKTGEEDEEILFQEKAKLLRFSSETKEWKEKGVGSMKILLNPGTGKIRLLMRRDQVFKVCCNHFLDENMEFKPILTSEKALTWCAQDYSDGDLKPQLLAIRFGKVESMKAFKKVIEDNQKKMKNGRLVINAESRKEPDKVKEELKPLSELFKAKPGSWECDQCYVRNNEDCIRCVSCEASKPGTKGAVSESAITSKKEPKGLILDPSLIGKFSFGIPSSAAPESNKSQSEGINAASIFGALATKGTSDSMPKFTFGISPSSVKSSELVTASVTNKSKTEKPEKPSFSFGGTPNLAKSNQNFNPSFSSQSSAPFAFTGLKSDEKDNKFGSTGEFTFSLSVDKPNISPQKKSGAEASGEESDNHGDDYGDDIVFKPVVQLPEKVTVHTGEEDETVLYETKGKLYRFRDRAWKERGKGYIKILKHKINNRVRLLMRWEQVLKVCLNHFVTEDMLFSPKDDKSLQWSAADFSEETIQYDNFAIRFSNSETVKEFQQALNAAFKNNSSPKSSSGHKDIQEDSSGKDISVVYEFKVQEDLRKKALELKLPPNFYSYLDAPDCSGCIGCRSETDSGANQVTKIGSSFFGNIGTASSAAGAKASGCWGSLRFDVGQTSNLNFEFGNSIKSSTADVFVNVDKGDELDDIVADVRTVNYVQDICEIEHDHDISTETGKEIGSEREEEEEEEEDFKEENDDDYEDDDCNNSSSKIEESD